MAVLSIAGARVGVVGSGWRSSWRLGDDEEDVTVVESAVVEPRTCRREWGENTPT